MPTTPVTPAREITLPAPQRAHETDEQVVASITRMREQLAAEDRRPTVELLRSLVDDIRSCRPLDETAQSLGLDRLDTLNLAARLGIWLSHVHGGANVPTITAASMKRQLNAKERRRTVVVPLGYQRGAGHHREVSRAIAAIVIFDPDDEELSRFISRQYKTTSIELDFNVVSSVWYAATQGRLHEVEDVNPTSARFVRSAVAAYDMLSVALERAHEGIRVLAVATADDPEAIEMACLKAEWLAEREMDRLRRAAHEAAIDPESLENHRILEREITFLHRRLRETPAVYFPERIADLSKAHVRKIAIEAGVSIDQSTGLKKAAVRTRLREMGFGSDVDMLIHQAVAAERVGGLDDFWEAMEARAAGEMDWDVQLAGRLAARRERTGAPAAVGTDDVARPVRSSRPAPAKKTTARPSAKKPAVRPSAKIPARTLHAASGTVTGSKTPRVKAKEITAPAPATKRVRPARASGQ